MTQTRSGHAVKHSSEESVKLSKLQQKKPHVWAKMQRFDEKIARGESIAIIRIEYDYACNFRCTHCCIDGFRGERRLLTPAVVADISRQADELGLARFVITGGEPLISPELDAIVAAIDPQKHYINVDTNGWFLNFEKAKHLKSIGVDRIQLSIDSLDETEHDRFRNAPGSHRMALQSINATIAAGLDLFIQTVVTKKRLYSDEFTGFIRYFNSRDIAVFVTFMKPVGAAEGLRDEMCGAEDFAYFDKLCGKHNIFWHLSPAYGRDLGCIAFRAMCSITPWGDVNGCPYWFKPMGNVLEEPLGAILARAMKTPPWDKHIGTCPVADKDWGPL